MSIIRTLFSPNWKYRSRADDPLGSPAGAPTAPQSLASSAITQTTATLTWVAPTSNGGSTILHYRVYRNNVGIANVTFPTLTYNVTGLAANTTYDFKVTAVNAAGSSVYSNAAVFTTSAVPGGIVQDPVIGVNSAEPEPDYYSDWQAKRIYRWSQMNSSATAGTKIIAVTDDPNISVTGTSASATTWRNALISFYEGSGSSARQDIEVHIANGNEIDRDWQGTTVVPTSFFTTCELIYNVVHEEISPGVRRFPKASMWIDLTTWQVTTANVVNRYRAAAPFLDGIAASMYPPGRQSDPVVWSRYSDYIDPIFDLAEDWRLDNPNIKMMGCWEVGSPIDHAFDSGLPNSGGTTNWSIRPRYFAGGRASGATGATTIQPMGSNYEGFLNYVLRQCVERQFVCKELIYWNEQSNPDIPNPFKHDRIGVSANPGPAPDTVTAWHDWTPNSRLADL